MRYTEENLKRAIEEAEANGKEPFDFKKFAGMYLHDTGNFEQFTGDEGPEVKGYYKRRYYLDYPQIMTIKEFANYLDEIESF